jgi:hypothetical protein
MTEETIIMAQAQILEPVEGELVEQDHFPYQYNEEPEECEREEYKKLKKIEDFTRFKLTKQINMYMHTFPDELNIFKAHMDEIDNLHVLDLIFLVQDIEFTIGTLSWRSVFKRFFHNAMFRK